MRALLCALAVSWLASTASAQDASYPFEYGGHYNGESGVAEYIAPPNSPLRASQARSMASLGDDALRFSTWPSLGGEAVVIEIRRLDEWASGRIEFYHGHPRTTWRRVGYLTFELELERYRALVADVDRRLSRMPKAMPADEMIICTDGPGFLTERRSNGQTRWLAGSCGDHPNNEMSRLMSDLVTEVTDSHLSTRR